MEAQDSTKLCSKCTRILSLSAFHRGTKSADGHATHCKECVAAYHRVYYEANKNKLLARSSAYQKANRAQSAAYTRAWRDRDPGRAREVQQRYQDAHPDRPRTATRRWSERNPEKVKAGRARFKERRPTYYADYYSANKERYRQQGAAYYEANKDRIRVRHQRWYQSNPSAVRALWMRRRARQRGATVGAVDFDAILARDGWICHLCGDLVMRNELSFDHIVPLNKGGAHSNDNLAVAHNRCNKIKKDRLDVPSKAPPRIRSRHGE